ncbi:hypothetical protein IWW50_005943 [Coemansia erecta]|nr:hypothetical protein IWW50_005943 [Coemansia erecta]
MSHIKEIFKRTRKSSSAQKDKVKDVDDVSLASTSKDADEVSIADTATLAPTIVGTSAGTSAQASTQTKANASKKKSHNFVTKAGALFNNNPAIQAELSNIDPTGGIYYL